MYGAERDRSISFRLISEDPYSEVFSVYLTGGNTYYVIISTVKEKKMITLNKGIIMHNEQNNLMIVRH